MLVQVLTVVLAMVLLLLLLPLLLLLLLLLLLVLLVMLASSVLDMVLVAFWLVYLCCLPFTVPHPTAWGPCLVPYDFGPRMAWGHPPWAPMVWGVLACDPIAGTLSLERLWLATLWLGAISFGPLMIWDSMA